MPIPVSCPGCKKRFNVDDKFAGKTGPCPHCKAKITVPAQAPPAPEVKVHAPEDFGSGGRSVTGKLLLKPIEREQTRFNPLVAAAIGGGIVAAIVYAVVVRMVGSPMPRGILSGVGLLLVAPPLAMAAYTFLRDAELEPYRGVQLYIRSAICGAIYAALWGVFAYVRVYVFRSEPIALPLWFVVPAPFLVVGGMAGKFALDLETANGFFHYAFYVAVTVLLGLIAGVSQAIWG